MASVGLNATCLRSPPGSKPASHPFALAILARAKSEGLAAPAVECGAALGKGVSGRIDEQDLLLGSVAAAGKRGPMTTPQLARAGTLYDEGKTISVLVVGAEAAGLIAMRDEPRADAKAGIEALSALGVASLMLTGNNDRTAAAIARGLGIELRAGLLPQDKPRIVRELQGNGSIVAKIGDGINDAPRSPRRMSASPWAAGPMSRWKRRMQLSCTAGSSTSREWSRCRAARWPTSART